MKTQWILAAALSLVAGQVAVAADTPGVTATEIKIGGVFPFSGPASSLGLVGRGLIAYIQSLNDRGGINGRKINYITYDDGYSPPKTVEHVRKLVESDEVAFMYGQLGTAGISATAKYLRTKGVPSVAIISGSAKFTNVSDYPLITTGLVSYDTEGKIYAKYLTKALPNAKYAILYQNDDLGKDYVNAFKSYLGKNFDSKVVSASYEVSEPTIDSQVTNLKSSGAEALVIAGTPKFAAQAIRQAYLIGWKATVIVNFPSGSVGGTLAPAGLDKSVGVIVGSTNKDALDESWKSDPGVQAYRAFFDKYLQGADLSNGSYLTGYQQGLVLEQILKQCGDDLSRKNILAQAKSLRDFVVPTALPGVKVNTSETENMIWTQMRLQRWTGSAWEAFGDVLDAKSD
ncbi:MULTISPECIES: ABC transporter substrate-binding protein [Bradyrhizobium]|jgi:ABC-type branched-subunit amino acid transport system substrate-binding protein|uniref:ABC transporter substrate-binding protein n=2 Tax=Bradyrhizobium TaxID=374 RepID=A0ABS5GDW8_9BRAD|nr:MULTISPECIES: ABC transporter substrate-binding protein [Bradyrhizobium]MBR1139535.1 ABC transporter substrate-binding protein [Bradyrhizobium denitrificans]MDU1494656.1 ABC transporter substrate-binding protein [Bradyrhizobium sp.]MDU1544778.1 ABC transporter substrate-binding protein [Bradyrhizobium sp.]MDU1668701.1 ABC transporter substrate-binding protein [Bradyrhizobium sp.]MDU1688247.1 ABC transporter substrate-binding protein [Bradyrhizobium sp.]